MDEFNLERARVYEENKIPPIRLYYSLVNKNLFFFILIFEIILISIANIFIPNELPKAIIICILLYLLTCIFGIIVSFHIPNTQRPGVELNIKLMKFIVIVAIPPSLAFYTFAASGLITIVIDSFITKGHIDFGHIFINTALVFMAIWLIFYIFHIYSDRELAKYLIIKNKLLAEGKTLQEILQIKEKAGKIDLKTQAFKKIMVGCKVINDDVRNLVIKLRTSPTKYSLIFMVALPFFFTVGIICIFAGVLVYFQESRIEPAAFVIGAVFFGIALVLKALFHKTEYLIFDSTKRSLFIKDKSEISFSEIKELKWEKDYLEYFFMQIPYFRLYAITEAKRIEIFRALPSDEIIMEQAKIKFSKIFNLS